MGYPEGTLGYLYEALKNQKAKITLWPPRFTRYGLDWTVVPYKEVETFCKKVWDEHNSGTHVNMKESSLTTSLTVMRKIVKLAIAHELIDDFGWKTEVKARGPKLPKNLVSEKDAKVPNIKAPIGWEAKLLEIQSRIQKDKSSLMTLLNEGFILSVKCFSDKTTTPKERRIAAYLRDLCEMTTNDTSLQLSK